MEAQLEGDVILTWKLENVRRLAATIPSQC